MKRNWKTLIVDLRLTIFKDLRSHNLYRISYFIDLLPHLQLFAN